MPDSCLGQAFCWVALLALPAWPAEFSGKVIGVTDGDTITVLHDRTPVKIRLHGIDCPENGQEYSARAKAFTSELAFGKVVTVRPFGQDRYERMIADVVLPNQ